MSKLSVALASTVIVVAIGITAANAARVSALTKNTAALTGTVVAGPVTVTGFTLPAR